MNKKSVLTLFISTYCLGVIYTLTRGTYSTFRIGYWEWSVSFTAEMADMALFIIAFVFGVKAWLEVPVSEVRAKKDGTVFIRLMVGILLQFGVFVLLAIGAMLWTAIMGEKVSKPEIDPLLATMIGFYYVLLAAFFGMRHATYSKR